MAFPGWSTGEINFKSLESIYGKMQDALATGMSEIASMSGASPGKFLALQFQMQKASQIGDMISNMMSAIQGISSNAIRNLKGG